MPAKPVLMPSSRSPNPLDSVPCSNQYFKFAAADIDVVGDVASVGHNTFEQTG
jgi:hypothetical protein